jgi:hypothetical protein
MAEMGSHTVTDSQQIGGGQLWTITMSIEKTCIEGVLQGAGETIWIHG